jgi:hypothetical protein
MHVLIVTTKIIKKKQLLDSINQLTQKAVTATLPTTPTHYKVYKTMIN